MILFTLILLVASIALNELLAPKPKFEDAKPDGAGAFQNVTATEGRVQPVIFGRVLLKGPNLIGLHDLQPVAITQKLKTSMFSSKRVTIGFRYNVGLVLALCRGPGVTLKRVLIGETEVFSGTVAGGGRVDIDEPNFFDTGNGFEASVDFYAGTSSQTPNAYLDVVGRERIATAITPTAPAYRGLSYVVLRELTNAAPDAANVGAYIGNQTTLSQIAFEAERFPSTFSGQSGGDNVINGTDANPANVIYEYLTNTEWGLGRAASTIDVGPGSSFVRASETFLDEGNGFAFTLDAATKAADFLKLIQDQIDGIVAIDPATGLWSINLAREAGHAHFGYDPSTLPEINNDNLVEVSDWTRGLWAETTNQVQVEFTKRADNYKTSFALAQDMGGAILAASGSTSRPRVKAGAIRYPGVKNSALANYLATRELRGRAIPLARGTFTVTREHWAVRLGDPIVYTDASKGYDRLVMRVTRIDPGRPEARAMKLTAVQDEFASTDGIFADPPPTLSIPPATELVAFPADEQIAIEAPRALIVRDPDYSGDDSVGKVFAAARAQGGEIGFSINQRNSSGSPSGAYALAGEVFALVKIGRLNAALPVGSAYPTTLTLTAAPDAQAAIESAFIDSTTLGDLGADLAQLVLVGDEFMLVQSAANSGADVALSGVYRGVLDSTQQAHSLGADVFLLFVGAGLTDTNFPNTNNVNVQLRAKSVADEFAGTVSTISLTMAKRALRPYAPSAVEYNGSGSVFGTPALEGDGSGLNGVGFDVEWRRRRFDTSDEVAELLADQAVSASTETRVRVLVSAVEAYDSGWVSGAGPVTVPQVNVVNLAAAGTAIVVELTSRHDYRTETAIESTFALEHSPTPTSPRSAQFYFGGVAANVATAAYTAASTGTFTVNIGTAYGTSNVQARLNGGAFATVVAAGATTGTFSVTSGDTIELRHTVTEAPALNFVELLDGALAAVAYGVLRGS